LRALVHVHTSAMEFVLVATRGSKKEKISSPPLLELSAAYFQPVSSIFLSHSQQYFQPLIFSPSEQAPHLWCDGCSTTELNQNCPQKERKFC
jgi:hypothetical protein